MADYVQISAIVRDHIAKRKGIQNADMGSFLEMAVPKIEAFCDLYDLPCNEKTMSDHYGHIMEFISKSDKQIDDLLDKAAKNGEVPVLSTMVDESPAEKAISGAGLKMVLMVVAFLFVAWSLGRTVFWVALALVGFYWYSRKNEPEMALK